MAPDDAAVAAPASDAPRELDPAQVQRASTALLKHISKVSAAPSNNLLPPQSQPISLIITAKTNFSKQPSLKPTKLPLPHVLHDLDSSDPTTQLSICLITTDPHSIFKELIHSPEFPDKDLQKCVKRIIGLKKLKERYKTFEPRRQLLAEHDVFLADDRAVTFLPKLLGKIFYSSTTKRPIPVQLTPHNAAKEKNPNRFSVVKHRNKIPGEDPKRVIAPPEQIVAELRRTLSCTTASLTNSPTLSIRVGNSNFAHAHLAANITAVVDKMMEKHVPGGWRGLKAIHVKGLDTMALPIWQAEELWIDEKHVLEKEEEDAAMASRIQGKKKRKLFGNGEGEKGAKKLKKGGSDEGMSKEMKERRERLRRQLKNEKESTGMEHGGEVSISA